MTNKTLQQLKNYVGKWVALSEPDERIVGSGNDVLDAQSDANKRGYKGELTLLKVFPFGQYVPDAHEI